MKKKSAAFVTIFLCILLSMCIVDPMITWAGEEMVTVESINEDISRDGIDRTIYNIEEDTEKEASFFNDPEFSFYFYKIKLNGQNLTVNGNLNLNAIPIDTGENGTLIVNGNFTTSEAVSIQEGGTVDIAGNYIQTKNNLYLGTNSRLKVRDSITFSGTGSMWKAEPTARAIVGGDFLYKTTAGFPTAVTGNNAKWTISGSVKQ
ncbi:MAG: hypothetical protein J5367_07025, partial [Lachnospiraceae bacterium]|nr:hypothetical protein [Lachnospiraceae bacterium]